MVKHNPDNHFQGVNAKTHFLGGLFQQKKIMETILWSNTTQITISSGSILNFTKYYQQSSLNDARRFSFLIEGFPSVRMVVKHK